MAVRSGWRCRLGCGGGGAGEGPAQVGVAAQVSWAGGLTGTPGPSLVCWFVLTTAGSSEPGVPSLGAAACPDLTSMVLAMSKAGRALVSRGGLLGDAVAMRRLLEILEE